jgi:hypothetical protein
MSRCHKMDLRQALTIAALVLEFEAESTDQQQTPGWINECLEAAQAQLLGEAKQALAVNTSER